jgi:hypothetical protein
MRLFSFEKRKLNGNVFECSALYRARSHGDMKKQTFLVRRINLMTLQLTELVLGLDAGPEADEPELSELSQSLLEDLREIGVESVESVHGSEAPPGSKGDVVTIAALAVTLAPKALKGLITMLQSWLTRHERTRLTLQKGDKKITVIGTLSKEQQQVIADWLHT